MNRLKKLRLEKGLTLKKVALDNDLAESQLSFYENGKRTPRDNDTWKKLADYFDVSISYLMGLSNQRVSETKALETAKKVYQSYLSDDDLGKENQKALIYFNKNDLDSVLKQAMQQYFTIPVVEWNTEFQSLKKTGFLYSWLQGYLVERYRKEVKTNHNLIADTYYNIPSVDTVNEYGNFSDEIQIPLTEEFEQIFKLNNLSTKVYEEIKKLFKSDSTLIAYSYESSVDDKLKDDINMILDNARSEILNLKEKYPDKPSRIEQTTVLISKDEDTSFWSRNGSNDYIDELNLSEETKKLFVHLGSVFIEEKKRKSKAKE
ncbi:TPA: helix-turn-helix domain-containing protein [Enterococcus faecalis]